MHVLVVNILNLYQRTKQIMKELTCIPICHVSYIQSNHHTRTTLSLHQTKLAAKAERTAN